MVPSAFWFCWRWAAVASNQVSRAVLWTCFLEGRDELRLEELSVSSSTLGRRRRLGGEVLPPPPPPNLSSGLYWDPYLCTGTTSSTVWAALVSGSFSLLFLSLFYSSKSSWRVPSLLMKYSKSAAGFALRGPSWPSGEDKGGRPWSSGPALTFLLCCVFPGALWARGVSGPFKQPEAPQRDGGGMTFRECLADPDVNKWSGFSAVS